MTQTPCDENYIKYGSVHIRLPLEHGDWVEGEGEGERPSKKES